MHIGSPSSRINYDHSLNGHTLQGPHSAFSLIFAGATPKSLLDVGCGTGTWLKAAMDLGVDDLLGLDGIQVPTGQLHVPKELILHHNLTLPWNLKRKFDAVMCLEVAEHLDNSFAETLIDALVLHGDTIYFSAACPGQIGQHHVNCQWPAYWQQMFNSRGYACEDSLRWRIWDEDRIEPWYRQNLFVARRAPWEAGHEPRIKGVVHPDILSTTISALHWRVQGRRVINRAISLITSTIPRLVRGLATKVKWRPRSETQ